ncbi:flagellar motor protein MotA [Alphaproteobacteria bacterium]|nr:flagellar motor protein MotA [Alphaproteobacteria bacterium]
MNSPNRFIQRMIIFIILNLILGFFLISSLSDAFLTNPIINGLIFSVLGFGIIIIFRQVYTLRPEIQWIEGYKRNKANGLTGKLDNKKLILLAPMASLLEEHKGRFTISSLAMRSLLDSLNLRLDETREIARYLIGLLVFLGLLGTFWGLLNTIDSVGEVINSLGAEDEDSSLMFLKLKEGLRQPLDGMGTAFSSSLFGLSGSLILGFLDIQASQSQNQFYNDTEEWLSTMSLISVNSKDSQKIQEDGVPVYVQALLEQTAESIDSLQGTLGRGEDERKHLADNFANLAEKMSAVADQIQSNQKALAKGNEKSIDITPLVEYMRDNPNGLDDPTKEHIRNMDISIRRLVEENNQGNRQLITELRSEIKLLAKTISAAVERK